MKLLRSWLGGVGGLMLSLLYAAPTLAGITLSVQPSTTTVNPGDTFSVAVQVSGLTSLSPREIVRSYDLLLGYDSSLLTAQSVTFGNYLDGGQAGGSLQSLSDPAHLAFDLTTFTPYIGPTPPDKAVEFSELSNLCGYAGEQTPTGGSACPSFVNGPYLIDIQPDTFNLVTISFLASNSFQGTTLLSLIDDSLMNPDQDFDMKGNSRTTPLTISLQNGQVNSTIPEPGTLSLLLGVGLVGIGRSAMRRRQNTAGLLDR